MSANRIKKQGINHVFVIMDLNGVFNAWCFPSKPPLSSLPNCPFCPSDAYLALERLEKYREKLNRAEDRELREALDRAISAIRSRLFQALLGEDRGTTETTLSLSPFTHTF